MPFEWMHVPSRASGSPAASSAAHKILTEEYRGQAGLLRRLGYPKELALRRCWARCQWDRRPGADPGLSEAELRGIVDAVYA